MSPMSRPRPLNFLLLCLALLVLQQVLSMEVAYQLWRDMGPVEHNVFRAALLTGGVHGLVLLVQLPRALRWRPRRNARPSADVLRERQRIARELHDRVGPQLVSALALIDPANPGQSAQRAILEHGLLELRLLVDDIDDPASTLADHLAHLRRRIQPVMNRCGIALEWDAYAAHLPGAPRTSLLALVAQEALSNVIQHAHATRVKVCLTRSMSPPSWQIEVVDDGQGTSGIGSSDSAGAGLIGMRERIRQTGGRFELLQPALGGTCVRASVPDRD